MAVSSLLLLPINLTVSAASSDVSTYAFTYAPTSLIPQALPYNYLSVERGQWYYHVEQVSPSSTKPLNHTIKLWTPEYEDQYLIGLSYVAFTVYGDYSQIYPTSFLPGFKYGTPDITSVAVSDLGYLSGVGGLASGAYPVQMIQYRNTSKFSVSGKTVEIPTVLIPPTSGESYGFLYIWFYFPSKDSDKDLSGAVNPGQDDANDQLGGLTGQLEDFDDQTFGDLNDGLGNLDFGMSGFSEVASGIAYITGIFMIIWNGIPNQIIVVALMLGLVTLVLGRGARLASAVDRAQRRRSRSSSKKG